MSDTRTGGFEWRWVAIGTAIMLGLNLVASLLLLPILGGAVVAPEGGGPATLSPEAVGGGRLFLAAVLSFASFAVGGYIIARRSTGHTVLEAGVAAAIAVAIGLVIGGGFSLGTLLVGALVPFLAGLLGAWIGERQGRGAA